MKKYVIRFKAVKSCFLTANKELVKLHRVYFKGRRIGNYRKIASDTSLRTRRNDYEHHSEIKENQIFSRSKK